MEEKIIAKVDELKDSMIESIRELVRIDSVETEGTEDAPFGPGVKAALIKALSISESMGFSVTNLDNTIGYAQYGSGEEYVCAIGHVDVVPPGDGWRQPPFSAFMEDGVIYGRGVLDNKGPVLTCLYGLYALKELGIEPLIPIRIIFGCDEESGFKDLDYYLKKERPPFMGFTPDCKYPVVYSERGRAVIRVHTDEQNLDPFFQFVTTYFIGAKNDGDRLGIDFRHEEYGVMEMRGYQLKTLKRDESGGREAVFECSLSYPKGITIDEILDRIKSKAASFGLEISLVRNYDPVVFPKEGPLVSALQHCYEAVTGLNGTPVTTTGGTYAKLMPGIVPFGPSFPGQKGIGHNPNEWMTVEDLVTNAKIYALSLYHLSCTVGKASSGRKGERL